MNTLNALILYSSCCQPQVTGYHSADLSPFPWCSRRQLLMVMTTIIKISIRMMTTLGVPVLVLLLLIIILVVADTQSDSIQCLNYAKKWFIQYSIQYCFTQDSIQNIIQFKKNLLIQFKK